MMGKEFLLRCIHLCCHLFQILLVKYPFMSQMLVNNKNSRLHCCYDIRLLQLNEQTLLFFFKLLIIINIFINSCGCYSVVVVLVSDSPVLLLMSYRTDFEWVKIRIKVNFRLDDRTVHATCFTEINAHIRVNVEVKSRS